MIGDGDRILLGISGGKDSLAMAAALALRRRWVRDSYTLNAVQIEWEEYPIPDKVKCSTGNFFRSLDIPYRTLKARMNAGSDHKTFNCYLCSRNRKRLLFETAESEGFSKIALGHHLDDIVETTLMNLCFHGIFSTMLPVQKFFDGKLSIIRPLCEVKESEIRKMSERLDFPVLHSECPYRETNMRARLKPIVRELSKLNRNVRENIARSPMNVVSDFLPTACMNSETGIHL